MVGTGWETGGRSGPAAGQDPTVPGLKGTCPVFAVKVQSEGDHGKDLCIQESQDRSLSLPAPGNEVPLLPSAGQMEH